MFRPKTWATDLLVWCDLADLKFPKNGYATMLSLFYITFSTLAVPGVMCCSPARSALAGRFLGT